jgi:hypothetical protein
MSIVAYCTIFFLPVPPARRQKNGCTSRWKKIVTSPEGKKSYEKAADKFWLLGIKKSPAFIAEHCPMPYGVDYHYLFPRAKIRQNPETSKRFRDFLYLFK